MRDRINDVIKQSIQLHNDVLNDAQLIENVNAVVDKIVAAYRSGHKVFFAGNGGSAADAQHLAAELSGRFYFDRPPLSAEALHVNTSFLTAVANDYSYDYVYERAIVGFASAGDVLVAISTSGNSKCIINAVNKARELGVTTVGMTGKSGGAMDGLCDFMIKVPSTDTPRIQEIHIMVGHIICELVEKELFA